jgi:hypothetical protein
MRDSAKAISANIDGWLKGSEEKRRTKFFDAFIVGKIWKWKWKSCNVGTLFIII